jgi:hypothetical protein
MTRAVQQEFLLNSFGDFPQCEDDMLSFFWVLLTQLSTVLGGEAGAVAAGGGHAGVVLEGDHREEGQDCNSTNGQGMAE